MGLAETLAKLITPAQAVGMLNAMSNADLEKALRDLEPQLSPDKFNIFLQVMSTGVARRYPKVH